VLELIQLPVQSRRRPPAAGTRSEWILWHRQAEWGAMEELTQLEEVMRQKDAVMEPGILVKLRQYVAKGGSPRNVVEMLTDNYVGIPLPNPPGKCRNANPPDTKIFQGSGMLQGCRTIGDDVVRDVWDVVGCMPMKKMCSAAETGSAS